MALLSCMTDTLLQVNWARWLVSWTMELKDAKCRPTGSPPGDSALSQLANQICNFPTHNPGCKFSQYVSKVLPRPISKVSLLLQNNLSFQVSVILLLNPLNMGKEQ